MNTVQETYKKQSLWRFLQLLKPKQRKYLAGLFCRALLTTIERIFIAFLLKLITDATVAGDITQLKHVVVIWIAFYVGFSAISPFILYLWRSAVFEATANVREVIFHHLQRLPLGYHELHHTGDALSILTNDVSAAEKAYQEDLFTLVEASLQGLTAAILMLVLNWKLALLIFLSNLAPLAVNALFAGPLRKVGQSVQTRLGALSERMTDVLAGFQVIRTFSLGDWILARFNKANDEALETSLRRVRLDSALAAGNDFAAFTIPLPFILGAFLVMMKQATFGTFIALVQLNNQTSYFVYALGGVISRIQSALAASDRIFALLDSPLEPKQYLPQTSAALQPSTADPHTMVEFKNVSFGYDGGEKIIDGVSFTISKGEFTAFAGPSGGGKSTIFKLLMGCYPLKDGVIFVGGKPLHSYLLTNLRELIAYVPQDAYLFAGTILDNIRYGKPGASDEAIISAAKAAFAHDFVMEFPDTYKTVVGEHGARLSGGQRQRIAIARAFLKDAPILLLDEATSALDSESEQIVQQALEGLMKDRTTLVIAHRFSTIVNADEIYVIDNGKLVEQGQHTDLMNQKGVYANLYDMQFKLTKSENTIHTSL